MVPEGFDSPPPSKRKGTDMYQKYGETMTISVNDWMLAGLSYSQFNHDNKDGQLTIAKRGINGNTLIDVKSIKRPDRRAAIEARFGKIDEEEKKQSFMDVTIDEDARVFFRDHTYTDSQGKPQHIHEETQAQYVNEASILNMFRRVYQRQVMARAANGKRKPKKEFFKECADKAKALQATMPNHLPTEARSMERKYDRYIAEGYQSLINGLYGKTNSEKLTEEAKFWLIARFASPIEKLTTQQLLVEYNNEVPRRNENIADDNLKWKPLKSEQTIYAFLNRPEIKPLWFGMRHGELKAKEKYTRQHKTLLPTRRDSIWYGDGTKLNYYYRNDKGEIATCNVYEVMDVYSEVLLGYHISDSEDFEAQYFAYRMAMQKAGHKPNEIRYDNQGGHKKLASGEFFSKLAHLNIPTTPYNGKSKTIESAFGRFQAQFLHKDWFFTGQNITAKKLESRENYEFIMANKANLPTLDEIKKRYAQRREEWNNAEHFDTGIPRIRMYEESVNNATTKVGVLEMIDMFGVIDGTANTYTASGITKTIKKRDYRWEVLTSDGMPDLDFMRDNVDRKFYIGYDLNDMSIVALYTKDAKGYRFVTYAQKYIEIHRAKDEQTEFDHQFIKAMDTANKRMRVSMVDSIEGIMERNGLHPAQHGLKMPKPRGINMKSEDIGRHTKRISNLVTADMEDRYDRF